LTEGGIYATIFYPRVKEYAQEGIASHSQILGHAIAHEIGHFLLGPVPHARFGIMRSEWTAEDLRSITMGAFLFNPRQSALIRRAAMRRLSSIISSVKRKTHLGRSKDELFPAVHRIDWAHPEFVVRRGGTAGETSFAAGSPR
jgi:hypothetical protein